MADHLDTKFVAHFDRVDNYDRHYCVLLVTLTHSSLCCDVGVGRGGNEEGFVRESVM